MKQVQLLKLKCFSDPPQVHLQLGSTLNPGDIKEGDDVYFECNIKANPKEHKITWHHDVSYSLLKLLFFCNIFYFLSEKKNNLLLI